MAGNCRPPWGVAVGMDEELNFPAAPDLLPRHLVDLQPPFLAHPDDAGRQPAVG